jgi:hypothetical protein
MMELKDLYEFKGNGWTLEVSAWLPHWVLPYLKLEVNQSIDFSVAKQEAINLLQGRFPSLTPYVGSVYSNINTNVAYISLKIEAV